MRAHFVIVLGGEDLFSAVQVCDEFGGYESLSEAQKAAAEELDADGKRRGWVVVKMEGLSAEVVFRMPGTN